MAFGALPNMGSMRFRTLITVYTSVRVLPFMLYITYTLCLYIPRS